MKKEVISLAVILMLIPLSFAGVGIKWERESIMLEEGGKACVSYGVYNPWPQESYVFIELSEELKGVLVSQETETKLIPANTPSSSAIPIEFCFEVPQVYEKDCFLGTLCKQDCSGEQKTFQGEVLVRSASGPEAENSGSGSATQMVVSAPLRIRVSCDPFNRDFTLVYSLIIIISLAVIAYLIRRKYHRLKAVNTNPKKSRKKKLKRNK